MKLISKANGSLTGRAALYLIGQLSLNCLSVVAAPVFVRLMTASEYGSASIFFTWTTLLSNVIGIRVDGTIQNAKSKYGDHALASYCSSTLCLSVVSLTVFLVLSVIVAKPLTTVSGLETPYWMLAVVTGFFLACSNVRAGYFRSLKKATGDLSISLMLAFLQVFCSIVFLMLVFDDGYMARVLGYATPTILIGLSLFVYFLFRGRCCYNSEYNRFCLSLCIPLIFNGIAYLLINQCGRLVINTEIGAEAAGYYSFAYSCALPISVITSAMGNAWTPEYYELLDNGNMDTISARANRYMLNITLLSCSFMLVSREVLVILGTEGYYKGIPMLPIIILAYYFQYLYTWPVNAKFYSCKTGSIASSTAIAAGINIVLCFALVRRIGAIGAAWASLVAFASLFLIHHITARHELHMYTFDIAWYMRGLVPVCTAMLATYALLGNMALRWVLAVVVSVPALVNVAKNRTLF